MWKIDRTTIFLYIVLFLFFWDLAFILGIRDPDRFPHPFRIFRLLGVSDFVRPFLTMIRDVIFSCGSGGIIGLGIGSLIVRNSALTHSALRTLRLGLWFPFMVLFATPDPFILNFVAVMLCSCYHYLVARCIFGLEGHETRVHVAREAILQALLISLLSQIWTGYWKWFEFAALYQPATGWGAFIALLGLLFFINWVFRSNFDLIAVRRGIILNNDSNNASWKSCLAPLLFAVGFFIIWHAVVSLRFPRFQSSLLGVVEAGYQLLKNGDISGDVGISLLEIFGGILLGGCIAFVAFWLMFAQGVIRNALCTVLPLLYLSPIVLWLLAWFMLGWINPPPGFVYFWHKVIAVGLLTFFTLIQGLWGLRDKPLVYRVLLAMDDAIPIAFVAMLFGELWAATAGLGFMMTVASATNQLDKGLAGSLITFLLLIGLSTAVRWIATRVSLAAEVIRPFPA